MHRSQTPTLRTALFAATLPLLALSWQPAQGASECKGLTQDACAANAECRWMEGYTRKDGVQVSSHCRLAKPRKKDTTETQAAAPTDAKPAMENADAKPEAATPDAKPGTATQ
ncbi:hypothetical protein [Allochromatium tepidum]|uniref:Uncharacterized protein n=1 Tax=Allochromatium tepidum TaxID=553982 RepID=A0ABM7QIS3_9GAMM|nr:hypothetical protein [Allochromatium tepidum]BCU05653.1 hypothetical protein Atep_03300 [Allochromatium tepidum]